MKPNKDILSLIGNTPIVKLNRIPGSDDADIYAKVEGFNPGGSVKDRIALSMIEDAEKEGRLRKGDTIIEPTSGNTGIGLAMVAAVKGYRMILVMSESMSSERRQLLTSYGAELILTPFEKGMKGAVDVAEEMVARNPNYIILHQFKNPANPAAHRKTTAREILSSMGNNIHAFIAGVGTGGTITGVGETLKKKIKGIAIVAVEPASSPVLSGGEPGPHQIAGIGAGFIPDVLNRKVYDEIIKVTDRDAASMAKRLVKEEGLLVGMSSGAAAWASLQIAKRLGKGKRVVTIFPDRGDRYLSTGLFG
ncbi:MAG: cysteine synthase A [Nitrospirota bacterium]